MPVPLSEIDPEASAPLPTGIGELDRVLAGGLVPGSVTLIGGEPGIGKSTLVLQAVASLARGGARALVVAAEESAEQVRRRAGRLGALVEGCYVLAATELSSALEGVGQVSPDVVVVDSIQAISDPAIGMQSGTTTQVRECATAFAQYAKATGTAVILVGHVTKDGSLAGPRTLEHLVDTVLSFEGDRHHELRQLTAVKHRFGSTGELGLFEMGESGLADLGDPSRILLADRHTDAAGTVVAPALEGRRPLLVEVQALVTEARGGAPRRVVQGLPPSRCALVLAVLERSLGIRTGQLDVYLSTVGGLKITEPGADLAVALAVVSAVSARPLSPELVAFGELGLTGRIRQAARAERRLSEAARLGFTTAFAPAATPEGTAPIEVRRVSSLGAAAELVGWVLRRPESRLPHRSAAHEPLAPPRRTGALLRS